MLEVPVLKFELQNIKRSVASALTCSLDDFKSVIDKKVQEFLTPERIESEISSQINSVFSHIIRRKLFKSIDDLVPDDILQIKQTKNSDEE